MKQSMRHAKHYVRKRDILRDYALVASTLKEQFQRFHASGTMSFSILQGLLGESHSKGLLWHLKDTAHYLFAKEAGTSMEEQYLDWGIGFLFHECMIMLESCYQLKKYYPAAQSFVHADVFTAASAAQGLLSIKEDLDSLVQESQHNISHIILRIEKLIAAVNKLMCAYFRNDAGNRPLARFIYDQEDLLIFIFGDLYEDFLQGIFGAQRGQMLREAAISLMESGHFARAERTAEKALAINSDCPALTELLDKIAQMRQ